MKRLTQIQVLSAQYRLAAHHVIAVRECCGDFDATAPYEEVVAAFGAVDGFDATIEATWATLAALYAALARGKGITLDDLLTARSCLVAIKAWSHRILRLTDALVWLQTRRDLIA